MPLAVGIDFGTTNSALAAVGDDGASVVARFALPLPAAPGASESFRSLLYFHPDERETNGRLRPFAGPAGIARYLEAMGEGRLIQSTKSFLASRLFTSTSIFGTVVSLPTLVGWILRALREAAEERLGPLGTRALVGRPVRFVNALAERDTELALRRLREAFAAAGFREIEFEYEPVGAAHHYESGLERDELVLIGDFGGGTSDFSLLRVGPEARRRGGEREILGTEGVAVAGDAFDARLVRHLVAPRLGRDAEFRAFLGRNVLPVPSWIYQHLERWHTLSMLKSQKNLQLLHDLKREASAPEQIEALLHLVEHDLGFHLYRAVEETKLALSRHERATFRFSDGPLAIEAEVTRTEFEGWIAEEVAAIAGCVDRLLGRVGVASDQVDRVFLTGGSSLVPAVRRVFEERFGGERLRSGAEFTSIASGLALRAAALGGGGEA